MSVSKSFAEQAFGQREDSVELLEDVLSLLSDADSTLHQFRDDESEVGELARIYKKTLAGIGKDLERLQKLALKGRQAEPDPDEPFDRQRNGDVELPHA